MSKFDRFRDYIWYNGEMLRPEDAKVSVMAHSMHYGSGFFEGIRAYETKDGRTAIFRLEEHVERLIKSARFYEIDSPYSKEEISEAIIKTVKENKFKGCYIRPLLFLGEGFNTISVTDDISVNMMVSCWELAASGHSCTLSVSSYRRLMSSQVPMQAKSIANYANSMLIRNEAKRKGDTDGIALDMQGYVSEASTANVFLVKNNVIYTPDNSSSILDGLTRQSIITIAKDLGFEVIERKIARDELYVADEIFITGTASEVKVCTHIDGMAVGNGKNPVSERLQEEFTKIALGENDKYREWLTYVE